MAKDDKTIRGGDSPGLPPYKGTRKSMRERLKDAGSASKAAREALRKKRGC